jgi:hypothetical protein
MMLSRAVPEKIAVETRFAEIGTDPGVLKWIVAELSGVLTLGGVPSVWLLLRVAVKVGALAL